MEMNMNRTPSFAMIPPLAAAWVSHGVARLAGLARGRVALALALAAVVWVAPAQHAAAQDFPQAGKTIRLMNPFPPGGTADVLSRAIAARMSQQLGATVVVENRPGASTMIAVNELRRSPPDGHTLLYTVTGTTAQLPHLYAKPPYDPFTSFSPITLAAYNKLILTVPASAPFNSARELVDYARANKGKLNYASYGPGSFPHIVSELLNKTSGLEITHVPFKGGADASQAILGGQVQMLFSETVSAINNFRGGKVKLLAVAGPTRIASVQQVPTMAEAGFPGFELPGLEQVLGPAGMPAPLVARINAEVVKALRTPEVSDLYAKAGFDLVASTPEEHLRIMRDSYERWGEVIRRTGIKLD
jgi:tripartite-type tricarboxylate transporter receptor subunit TctC